MITKTVNNNNNMLSFEDIVIASRRLQYTGYYQLYEKCKKLQPLERIFYLKYLQETEYNIQPTINALLRDIDNKDITFE